MVVQLEKQEAVLPLNSVAREFRIDPESPDGQMLSLIEQALDFVVALRLGDPLPSELNGGEASWKPNEQDQQLAISRVNHNFIRCVFARMGQTVSLGATIPPVWDDSPHSQTLMKQAIDGAAAQLDGIEVAEVTARIKALTEEMACIETMRRILIRGMTRPREQFLAVPVADVPASRRDTVKQVQALARRGLKEITNRLDMVDARLDDILAMLRDLPNAVAWLRQQRDWLFRTNHAWAPTFADWARTSRQYDDFFWKVVERSYSFLAPRFMTFQEWGMVKPVPKQKTTNVTVW